MWLCNYTPRPSLSSIELRICGRNWKLRSIQSDRSGATFQKPDDQDPDVRSWLAAGIAANISAKLLTLKGEFLRNQQMSGWNTYTIWKSSGGWKLMQGPGYWFWLNIWVWKKERVDYLLLLHNGEHYWLGNNKAVRVHLTVLSADFSWEKKEDNYIITVQTHHGKNTLIRGCVVFLTK